MDLTDPMADQKTAVTVAKPSDPATTSPFI